MARRSSWGELSNSGGFKEAKQFEFNLVGQTGSVPEPATWLMMIAGLGSVGFAGWGGVEYGLHRSAPRTDLDTVLHHDLDLTGDQERDVRALETAFARDRDALEAEMRAANRDLARAITEEHA